MVYACAYAVLPRPQTDLTAVHLRELKLKMAMATTTYEMEAMMHGPAGPIWARAHGSKKLPLNNVRSSRCICESNEK